MTWVLLRGLTREARHWGSFAAQFEARLAFGNVVALDLPGNGEFNQQLAPVTVQAMVVFARQQLLTQGIKPPYNLLAMSLGGMVATSWAQHFAHEIDRLVLINTSMRPFSSVLERLRPANWLRLGVLAARWAEADHADFSENMIYQLTCNRTQQRDQDLALWHQIRRTAPVSRQNAMRQLVTAARFSCANAAPPCPVLVLSSGSDRLVNSVCSTQLAQAWQATHHSHPWAGHDLPHDDGEWVCEHIATWLDNQ